MELPQTLLANPSLTLQGTLIPAQKSARGQGEAETVFKGVPEPPEHMAEEHGHEKPAPLAHSAAGKCGPPGSRERRL